MPENVMDTIVSELKRVGSSYYPQRGELRNVRVVGHTPKNDHYIYDIVMDFADGSERLAAKVYRTSKCGQQGARTMAQNEAENLNRVYEVFQQRSLSGVPRPIGLCRPWKSRQRRTSNRTVAAEFPSVDGG
jgi:hypothetical protein